MTHEEGGVGGRLGGIDQAGFGTLVEPHRPALLAHCYRMMGSLQDAEDMVQETFLRAWRRRETYAGRASVRAWLYKIATNVCIDTLAARPRRAIPRTRQAASSPDQPMAASVVEPIWLEPFPDEWLTGGDDDPEGYVTAQEGITLAFIAALHLLPPRQRAVLILRDVLELEAGEVAGLLEMSVPAVKSALHRARSTLSAHGQTFRRSAAAPAHAEPAPPLLSDYVRAWEDADVDLLISLLKDDATFSMPPTPSWYQGRADIHALISKSIFAGDAIGRWRLLPTRANGQQGFGLYRVGDSPSAYHAYGIQVLTLADGAIADIITFRVPALAVKFDLPQTLP